MLTISFASFHCEFVCEQRLIGHSGARCGNRREIVDVFLLMTWPIRTRAITPNVHFSLCVFSSDSTEYDRRQTSVNRYSFFTFGCKWLPFWHEKQAFSSSNLSSSEREISLSLSLPLLLSVCLVLDSIESTHAMRCSLIIRHWRRCFLVARYLIQPRHKLVQRETKKKQK